MNFSFRTPVICCIVALMLVSCSAGKKGNQSGSQTPEPQVKEEKVASNLPQAVPDAPQALPVRYQTPTYFTENEQKKNEPQEDSAEYQMKVGATIRTTGGPQPLWDIMKRIANLKGMSVSWASDVDQNAMVDVDIAANDGYFEAIDNLLRQRDYFHKVEGKTIVVGYRETRQYHLPVPYMRQNYSTVTGGNFLAQRDGGTGTEGTVKIASNQNELDIWQNVKLNLDTILDIWTGRRASERLNTSATNIEYDESGKIIKKKTDQSALKSDALTGKTDEKSAAEKMATAKAAKETTSSGNSGELRQTDKDDEETGGLAISSKFKESLTGSYTVDENLGIITVSAPRPLLKKVENYLENLKKHMFRQVTLEAKIIEVFLGNASKIGLDWSQVIKGGSFGGTIEFGKQDGTGQGQVYPWEGSEDPDLPDPTRFVSKVLMKNFDFTVLLNAIEEQGEANVLSNPKTTVLNGQPSLISIGTDVAYIKEITSETQSDTGTVSYTVQTDSVVEGVALGVVPSIIDDKKVVLHLTPITTEIVGDEIPEKRFGPNGELVVGLPIVRYREMSTMVQVNDGEMLIIGGLIDKVTANADSGLPVVNKLPFVKYLFGYEEKKESRRELVILLIPKIHSL